MFRCPRRDEGPFAIDSSELDDWRPNGTCSYCGSAEPGWLMGKLEVAAVELGPTDKSYKVYLKSLTPDPAPNKFYFQHLSPEQQARFIRMMNDHTLILGHPGHFYVCPYFATSV
jgi:hypothetical protein